MKVYHRTKTFFIAVIVMLTWCSSRAQYHVKPFDISKKITALVRSDNGSIYYGTDTGEFGIYDGLQFHRIENLDGKINAIDIGDNHSFLSTGRGLYEVKEDRVIQISRNNIDVLARSADNNFLVTSTGVYRKSKSDYSPDKERFYRINEIQKGDYFSLGDIDFFRADNKIYAKRQRWNEELAYENDDFSVIPWNSSKMIIGDQHALYTMDREGTKDTLLHLEVEEYPRLFKLSGSELLVCANNSIGVFDMRKRELNNFYSVHTEFITTATVDAWGNIWIAAGSYLYQVIDRSKEYHNQPPNIAIDAIRINGQLQPFKTNYRIGEDVNEIEIDYSGVQMTYPQNLEFQTRLTGTGSSISSFSNTQAFGEWSQASKSRNIEYRNLQAGKYSFQMRATVDGQYFRYSDTIIFNVESDLFQSIWLILILGALGILLVALFFNNRYNSLKKKSDEDRRRLIQENRVLTLQQKALQLQMNPHFVFNSLNSIQGLIAMEENQKARKYLQEFSTMMRSVLNQSREETILLSDEVKYLKSYLNLEQMANNDRFDWEVEVEEDVEDDIRIPTMIVQPFVENAIIHGVKSLKDRRGSIRLEFGLEGTNIICRVIDNGIGREAAGKLKSSNHKSIAIQVVQERLKTKLSRSRGFPIRYEDVLNEDNRVVGTEVSLTIPIMN